MTDHDAFRDEMDFLGRISDEGAERLLAGDTSEAARNGDLEDVAAFITALRVAVPAQPSPEVEVSLVPELALAARSSTDAAASAHTSPIAVPQAARWRRRLAVLGRVAIAVAVVPAAMAGLAFAGVRLPEPAREAFDRVGVELPNQAEGDETSSDGSRSTDEGEPAGAKNGEGSAKGEGSAEGAGSAAAEPAKRGGHGRPEGDDKGSQGSPGRGNSEKASSPGETGPTGIPPGQGGVPPGQGGTPPGQGDTPLGQASKPPKPAKPPKPVRPPKPPKPPKEQPRGSGGQVKEPK